MQLVMYLLDTRICYSSIEASCWPPIDCMIKLMASNFQRCQFCWKMRESPQNKLLCVYVLLKFCDSVKDGIIDTFL